MSIQGGPRPKKPARKRAFQPKRVSVNFRVPKEFEALCASEQIAPGELMRQFIADLCDIRAWTAASIFGGNGDAAHRAALAYHQVASAARQSKAQTGAAAPEVPSSQPQPTTRATTPIAVWAAAVERERQDKP